MTKTLSNSERDDCLLGVETVFRNPFDPAWSPGMAEYAGLPASSPRLRIVEAVVARIELLLQKHVPQPHALKEYAEKDAELLRILGLYVAYTTLIDPLDRLISRGGEGELTGWMGAFRWTDLTVEDMAGFVACFYQFRRGYLFLSQRIAGNGEAMERFRHRCWQTLFGAEIRWYVRSLWGRLDDCPVLLTGETGVGKSRVARLLGESGFIPFVHGKAAAGGGRGHFLFSFREATVPVVIPEYSEGLIESALFGHRKGAFTGADRDVPGVFEQCRPHGIAFLDEIGDIPPHLQTKLLRLLQDRRFRPVGGTEDRPFEGRVVAATHQDLVDLRSRGAFRDDLYFRLCSQELNLPPLRVRLVENPDELFRLVQQILEGWLRESSPQLSGEIVERLQRDLPAHYSWPGNIRELEQAVRRCCLSGTYPGDPQLTPASPESGWPALLPDGPIPSRDLLARYCRWLYLETRNYSEVARITGLDRRTVKGYIGNPAETDR